MFVKPLQSQEMTNDFGCFWTLTNIFSNYSIQLTLPVYYIARDRGISKFLAAIMMGVKYFFLTLWKSQLYFRTCLNDDIDDMKGSKLSLTLAGH